MKKMLCAALILMLCVSCAAAETFHAETAYEARMKALDQFDVCAMSAEYPGENSVSGHLIRWDGSIRIFLEGSSGKKRSKLSQEFPDGACAAGAGSAQHHPDEEPGGRQYDHLFRAAGAAARSRDGLCTGNWGFFHYEYREWRIRSAQIAIATDVTTQTERNHIIREEIVGALGLANDHEVYSDSILYEEWTTVQQLSEVDWIMLNMLYSPLVEPGMTRDQLRSIFMEAWSR